VTEVRKRTLRDDVKRSRAARQLLMPINRQIAGWQIEAARLKALSERGLSMPQTRARAELLEQRVSAEFKDLSGQLQAAPEGVLEVGRVLDTLRALERLVDNLEITRQGPGSLPRQRGL
jgi:uncharacterized protein YhdP